MLTASAIKFNHRFKLHTRKWLTAGHKFTSKNHCRLLNVTVSLLHTHTHTQMWAHHTLLLPLRHKNRPILHTQPTRAVSTEPAITYHALKCSSANPMVLAGFHFESQSIHPSPNPTTQLPSPVRSLPNDRNSFSSDLQHTWCDLHLTRGLNLQKFIHRLTTLIKMVTYNFTESLATYISDRVRGEDWFLTSFPDNISFSNRNKCLGIYHDRLCSSLVVA